MFSGEPTPILVVEDSEDDLFFFQRLLQKAGITVPVAVATDGQQAIDYLQARLNPPAPADAPLPRLIFLDLKLPLKGGFEVLQWIRAQPALARVVIVVLSSSAETRDVRQAFTHGAQGYLVKYPEPLVFMGVLQAVNAFPADGPLETLSIPGSLKP